jgi:molybdate transport system ATP-binding protein
LGSGPIAEMLTRFDLPMSRGVDAEAIVEAQVTDHDEMFHLTQLAFPGGQFQVTREELDIGQRVRLRVLARDVSLTLEHQTETSILNILPVTVVDVADEGSAQVMIKLSAGGTFILSRVTRKSAQALRLKIGKEIYAQIKTVALLA